VSVLCLDTSAYSHFRRGEPGAVAAIESARRIAVPAIVLGELRAGFRLGSLAERNETELRRFLAHPVVAVLDVDDEAATHYAELILDLRKAGRPLPTNDVWIGALALREGATVLTYDAHFGEMRRVGVRVLERRP
jgi:tRNA(fMet)-specific endonuclease VapC